jgi:hypothetical protein
MKDIGWKWLFNARKWHYFLEDGKSLCGSWMTLTKNGGEFGNDDSADNCAMCRKLLKKGKRNDKT